MFTGLEHMAIASPNPKQLAEWYVETLGFRINFEYDGNFFIRAQDGGMIEIIPSQGERSEALPRTPGLRHLAISVDDFDAAYSHLQTLGVKFTGEPCVNRGNRLVFFNDLDGNLVHLIQREQTLP
ncbi:MAG: VOC family protein [Bryobacteraceae bacterium]